MPTSTLISVAVMVLIGVFVAVAQIGNAHSYNPWCYWDEPAKAYGEAARYAYSML